MSTDQPLQEGQTVTGSMFNEPMRVESIRPSGPDTWSVGLAGVQTDRFRRATLTTADIKSLQIYQASSSFTGDGKLLRIGIQALALGIAWEYDPYFGLSISRVDPLPHQLEAVYDYLLKLARVRFLLADDAGAGKTIMSGLLIRELELRGLAERILIVCPANLAFQWQRELNEKFGEKFTVLKGHDIREQFGMNQWMEQKRAITSFDLAKRFDVLPGLAQVHWDLVIVDEAHRMSAPDETHKSLRYKLGELLRDTSDHLLLLTATPHKGDPVNFTLFLQLLDADAFADVRSIRKAMENRRAPFYLRRTKEAMVHFPQLQPDGTWDAKKIFTKRIPHTAAFQMDGPEFTLYRDVTQFVKRNSARAAADEEDPRSRAVGFLMSLYQRRLASSTYSMRRSLENRAQRLTDGLSKASELLAKSGPFDIPDEDEMEEMEESERESWERKAEAVTISQNADQVREEIQELKNLAQQAQIVEDSGEEAKLHRLEQVLKEEGFFDEPTKRLLIFTEFKDTLDYLVKRLESWNFKVGYIHGSMKAGSREEEGTRLYMEQQFRDAAIQILVATEAAGEGINLQVCHILFNYDIPWNPNRLEQRMGRIHRYGQTKDCLIFNFVAENTIEGKVLGRLMEKLQEIRNALDDDAVFNVVGEVLPASHVDRVMRDYYAGKLGDADLEDRLLEDVDEQKFRSICQNALEGLASKKLNLAMLIERRAMAQERRVVPETIARFIRDAAEYANLELKTVGSQPHTFDPGRTPSTLRRYESDTDWKLPALANKYPRCSTDRETAEKNTFEWVTPGHPLFEAIRRHAVERSREACSQGACFYSLNHTHPSRIDFFRARVVDGLGRIMHEKLFAVELADGQAPVLREPSFMGDFTPCEAPGHMPSAATIAEPPGWLHQNALAPFLEETRKERIEEVQRIADHVELSLTELIHKADEEIGRAAEEVEKKVSGAEGRLKQAEDRHTELLHRRDRRRKELEHQKALSLQAVERIASALVLPHPDRSDPDLVRMRQNLETEATAMRVVMDYERAQGRQVYDVHEKNLGYDITSLDLNSGNLRLIEIKGLGAASGTIMLTPNERRVAEDRRDCYWLYIVTNCSEQPVLQEPIADPAQFPWREVVKVQHYYLAVDAMTQPMTVREDPPKYGDK